MSGARTALERIAATAVSWPPLIALSAASRTCPAPSAAAAADRAYVRAYGVDLSEAALPADAYPSFSAFFTRRLREAARPIETEPGVVVSPSDSRLASIGRVPEDGRLEQVKGDRYSLEALLGSSGDAEALRGGQHATLYLSPSMYHRVHSPVDGRIVAWRYVPGLLFPVNAMGVRSVPGLFTRNERVVVLIETEAHGRVAVVLVGATNVGRIQLAFAELETNRGRAAGSFAPPRPLAVRRGDELGVFNLGSTVVLLVADPRLERTFETGSLVRVGQALGAARSASRRSRCRRPRSRRRLCPRSRSVPGPSSAGPATASSGARWGRSASSRSPGRASCRSTCCTPPVRSSCGASGQPARDGESERRPLRLPGAAAHAAALDGGALLRGPRARPARESRDGPTLAAPHAAALLAAARRPLEPLPEGGHFGNRRVINGEARSPHGGVDFSADLGVLVHAAAGRDRGDGGPSLLRRQRGLRRPRRRARSRSTSTWCKVAVAGSQALARGALIGEVGATGRATGPHLHFGIRWRGARVDPALLLAPPSALPCLDPPAGLGCRR